MVGVGPAIQRRTRILERVKPPQQQAQRYAVQRHTRGWVVGILLAVSIPTIVIGAVVATAVSQAKRAAHRAMVAIDVPRPPGKNNVSGKVAGNAPSWQGTDSVLLIDVDQDGVPELVGRGREVQPRDLVRVIALDLMTGKQKWQTEPLGTYSETYQGPLATGGDLLLFASAKGEVQAFTARDGTRLWKAKLEERVQSFCMGDDQTVIAVGTDDMVRTLSRVDGTIVGPARPTRNKGKASWDKVAPCAVMQDDDETLFQRHQKVQHNGRTRTNKTPADLTIDVVIAAPGGGTIMSGVRKQGTRVTTLVAVDDKGAERWRATGAADPLGAEGHARQMAVGDQEVCIIYYGTEYRLACFSVADGSRKWDQAAPTFANGLVAVGRSLVLTTSRDLRVIDLDTGTARWSLD
jgi:outer membrane protein assembly factor BamB